MTELEFKNTNPADYGEGSANLLYSSSISTGSILLPANKYGASGSFSYDNEITLSDGSKEYRKADAFFPPYRILGLTIPFKSSNDVQLEATLNQVDKVRFTFGGASTEVEVQNISKRSGYYYLRTSPFNVNTFPGGVDNSGTPYDTDVEFIFNPYLVGNFANNDFNATIGNATDIVPSDVAMVVDRQTDQLTPSNLTAITNETATKALIQYSNYTVTGWTNARYHGSKIDSGSVVGDDPAGTFKVFKGGIYPKDSSVTTILGSEDVEAGAIYFNVDRIPTSYQASGNTFVTASSFPIPRSGSGSISGFDGNFLFEEQGNRLIRLVDKKVHAVDKGVVYTTDELGRILLEQS